MKWLTFDDVALLPTYSELTSRTEPDIQTKITKKVGVTMPFLPSPMSSVIGQELGRKVIELGLRPIFHRFYQDDNEIRNWINEFGDLAFISWGFDNLDKLRDLLDSSHRKPRGICIDVAHGHCKQMRDTIGFIKQHYPNFEVIAGSISTPNATMDLISWGADAVRVGQGGGAACTTRLVTGFGPPQFTALLECSRIAKKHRIPIIADGGIRDSRDVALALAAGASIVMMGKLFAATNESAAEEYGEAHKIYKGQASAEFQKTGRMAEGGQGLVKKSGKVEDLLYVLSESLRTSFAYAGARTIEQFQMNSQWVEVGNGYRSESSTRFDE